MASLIRDKIYGILKSCKCQVLFAGVCTIRHV